MQTHCCVLAKLFTVDGWTEYTVRHVPSIGVSNDQPPIRQQNADMSMFVADRRWAPWSPLYANVWRGWLPRDFPSAASSCFPRLGSCHIGCAQVMPSFCPYPQTIFIMSIYPVLHSPLWPESVYEEIRIFERYLPISFTCQSFPDSFRALVHSFPCDAWRRGSPELSTTQSTSVFPKGKTHEAIIQHLPNEPSISQASLGSSRNCWRSLTVSLSSLCVKPCCREESNWTPDSG